MANANLTAAKEAKNDEFYTQLPDIQAELSHYPDKFRGKRVFCNCDDPFESNFVKYFLMNFNRLGLKELISTGYKTSPFGGTEIGNRNQPYALRVTDTAKYLVGTQKDLDVKGAKFFLEAEGGRLMTPLIGNPALDAEGKQVYVSVKEKYTDGTAGKEKTRTVRKPLYYEAGDFRSDMYLALLDEADVVVTNPPFSLFREFVALLVEKEKEFLIWSNNNAITYKEIFPLIKDNKMWLGHIANKTCVFRINNGYAKWDEKLTNEKNDGYKYGKVPCISVFTNLDHAKRHTMLPLDLGYVYEGHEDMYPKYDNYDAINVDKVEQIPCDYMGVMGVPITFLDKYCPEQFEIVDALNRYALIDYYGVNEDIQKRHSHCCNINGKSTYYRIVIRRKIDK